MRVGPGRQLASHRCRGHRVKSYDPAHAPSPSEWLALPELEQIELVEAHHRISGGFGEDLRMHAVIHVVIENQIAMQNPPETAQALTRLLAQGLDRHEAMHAVGSVLLDHIFPVLKSEDKTRAFDSAAYVASLRQLSADSWRAYCQG
jgi:hypothetical protein